MGGRPSRDRDSVAFLLLGFFIGAALGAFSGYLVFLVVRELIGAHLHLRETAIFCILFFGVIGGGIGGICGMFLDMVANNRRG